MIKVKELDWNENEASSPVGHYRCQRLGDKWEPLRNGYFMLTKWHGIVKAFDTIEEAKAAAQSDYERRILSALSVPVPVPAQEAEPFAWYWHDDHGCLCIAADSRKPEFPEAVNPLYLHPTPAHSGEAEAWRYEIQYGPEGEANYAWVYRGKDMVATMKTHHAIAVVNATNGSPAHSGEREAPHWREMDSAPLDGKHCILAVKCGAFIYSVQGAYGEGQWDCALGDNVKPLYWMPNVRLPDGWESKLADLEEKP